MTPRKLRELADACDARALEELDVDVDKAAHLSNKAERLRRMAAAQEGLPRRAEATTVVSVMTDSHREALSNSRGLNSTPAMRAARKAGLPSLRAVASSLGADPGNLSKIFRGKRSCPLPLAEAFEKLTGYPTTRWKR